MFLEIEKKKTPFSFGSTELWLRYDNAALLEIEKSGFDPFDINAVNENGTAARTFLLAGLRDCAEALEISDQKRGEIVSALMSGGEDTAAVFLAITAALLAALPPKNGSASSEQGRGRGSLGNLFSVYCDIMKKPDEAFWNSTLREVSERWERYAVLKGYKKPPIFIQRYDD